MENAFNVFINLWTIIGIIGGNFFVAAAVYGVIEAMGKKKAKEKFESRNQAWPGTTGYSKEGIKKIQHFEVKPGLIKVKKDEQPQSMMVQPKKRGRKPGISPFRKTEPGSQEAREKYARRPFVIPTVDEVMTYCKERENSVDPQKFVDFYTAKGWVIGKNPMKDWEAAVRTWERQGVRPTLNTKDEATKMDRLDPTRPFNTSEGDVRLARHHLTNWMRVHGSLTEEQIMALRGTTGLLWKSMSEPQRAQIISVFNDVRKKRGLIK